ncbi:cytochrome b/b6 domain-containing protein [Thalassobius sp. S69A]|uniref:cytochrome b/b6 domain-containing protein n=1 Tax=unclassified Thalassovita TaxID=2619711 RepID=UPI003C7B87BC
MTLHNTVQSYGPVARGLHWLTAALILAMIPLGFIAENLAHAINAPGATPAPEDFTQVKLLFSIHKTLGVVTFFVALLRILWAFSQPRPAPLHPERRLETLLGELVHFALYGAIVIVPLSGWVHHAATTGFAPIWGIGQSLPFVPKSESVALFFSGVHEISAKVLIGALLLHIAGAVKHQIIDRDLTLARMTKGVASALPDAKSHVPALPVLGAVAIWGAVALGAWGASGIQPRQDSPAQASQAPAAAPLQTAASDWHVRQGSLNISVQQMGSTVTGAFSDWTAAITFDPKADGPIKGQVSVAVAIASLRLGTVTQQAMGPDYFDAQGFPTARFEADIVAADQGYVADGTLTIKGHSVPLSLPFDLTLEADTATAQGSTQTDRRDFQIGTGMTDEGSLAFGVGISFDLTATRTAP